MQDGPAAGQTVQHVHIHVIPRKEGDFEDSDELYSAVGYCSYALHENANLKRIEFQLQKNDKEAQRRRRPQSEMFTEAGIYRKYLYWLFWFIDFSCDSKFEDIKSIVSICWSLKKLIFST